MVHAHPFHIVIILSFVGVAYIYHGYRSGRVVLAGGWVWQQGYTVNVL